MKIFYRFLLLAVLIGTLFALSASALGNVVYLADGGVGDGTSASTPVGTLVDAYNALGTQGGTIVICDKYTFGATTLTPAHTGTVTITNAYNGIDYREGGAELYFSGTYALRLQGDTVFDNIRIVIAASKTPYVAANFNALTFGYDVAVVNPDGNQSEPLRVYGGSRSDRTVEELAAGQSSSLEFYSGLYTVHAFSYDVSKLVHEGTMNITVGGTGKIKDLWFGIYNSTTSYGGTVNLTMKENARITNALYMSGNKDNMYLNGDVTISLSDSASIAKLSYYDKETRFPSHTRTLNITGDGTALPSEYADCFDVIIKDGVQIKPELEPSAPTVVFVATAGSGDGLSAETPIASLADAYAFLPFSPLHIRAKLRSQAYMTELTTVQPTMRAFTIAASTFCA